MTVPEEKLEVIRERTVSKVLWGEHDSLVEQFLKDKGVDEETRARLMEEAHRIRTGTIRKRSAVKMIGGFLLAAGFAVYPIVAVSALREGNLRLSRRGILLIGGSIFLCVMSGTFAIRHLRTFATARTAGAALYD